jgi:predicted small secreted protein
MIGNTIRKILVALIVLAPVFSYTGCKKQTKCGCGKDVLHTFTKVSAYVYWDTGATISFQTVGDVYSSYTLCNPSEMLKNMTDSKSGDILLVSGYVYWDCNYVYQASNSPYQSMGKVYQFQATDISLDLYGKNKPAPGTQLNHSAIQN